MRVRGPAKATLVTAPSWSFSRAVSVWATKSQTRAVLSSRGVVPVPQPLLESLREHDKRVDAAAIRLETHLQAIDSYARDCVKQGVIFVLSAFGIVVLSILLKAML